MKNTKGITLIALVITIIVLLILAGVSIAMLTGENGILTRANDSKVATDDAEVIEKVNMELAAQLTNALAGRTFNGPTTLDLPENYTATGVNDNEGTTDAEKSYTITITKPDDSKIGSTQGKVTYDTREGWKMIPLTYSANS